MYSPSRFVSTLLCATVIALTACRGEGKERGGGATPAPPGVTASATPAPVPESFQALYDELEAALTEARQRYAAMPAVSRPLLAAELLPANGNRGAELLQPGALEGVRLYLDALQRLGARAVNLSIVFPLFGEQEPRQKEYVAFYREVVAECRRRGLAVSVEMGPAFSGTPYSTLSVDYSGLTPQSYLDARLRQAALAAHALEPDYLTLAEEQDTERMLTGLDLTVEDYVAMLRRARAVIDPPPGVLLGAGSGSWEPPGLIDGILSETDLDFVNIHVYPLTNGTVNYIDRVADWATRARAARKRVIVGETWLYKASAQDLRSNLSYDQVFARDVFSFWAPLDALHVETMRALAKASGIEYVSFFWSKLFFAYLDYGTSSAATGADLIRLSNAAAVRAIFERRLTASGEAFRRAAAGEE